jgi:hypothetical protein
VTPRDGVFEPLQGKGRPLRQALGLLVERWTATPLGGDDLGALEQSLMHLFRRAQLRRQLPLSADPAQLGRDFLAALREGRGAQALAGLPATSPPPTGQAGRPTGT